MTKRLTPVVTILLAAVFALVAVRLFGIQFSAGDVYPEYSSLRSDPNGTKLLFDALSGIRGVRVERNYLPLEYLPDHGATVLFLSTSMSVLAGNRQAFEKAATRGNRIVAALDVPKGPLPLEAKLVEDVWHMNIVMDDSKGLVHTFYFGDSNGWRVLDRVGAKAYAIERDFGRGSVALYSGSLDFNNQSTLAADRLRQVCTALGPNSYIVFDEQHLGIAEGGSIMQMARRFRLTGMVLGLLLVAALFVWRDAAGFPPAAATAASDGRMAGRTSQAGLLTLLRRHVPPRELAAACWQEWLNGNRGQVTAGQLERCNEIAAREKDRPLEAAREIAAVLHAKGEL